MAAQLAASAARRSLRAVSRSNSAGGQAAGLRFNGTGGSKGGVHTVSTQTQPHEMVLETGRIGPLADAMLLAR